LCDNEINKELSKLGKIKH